MQHSMDKFSQACDSFGLTISIKKTEVMYQPAPGKQYVEPSIQVHGSNLKTVDRFTYLGSTLSRSATIDDEINSRVAKASTAFGKLRSNVWERRGIRLETKLKVYKAVIITTLMYGCEAWTIYARHAKQLNHFHMTCLRRLLNIRWQDKIPDTEVLTRANLPSIHTILQQTQVRWAGHVCRMSDERLPKQLLYGELSSGKRSAGGQRKRYKDTLKSSLKKLKIDTGNWECQAMDRPTWRSRIHKGAEDAETERKTDARRRRERRKARVADTTITTTTSASSHTCTTCGRHFRAKIGLISHLRTHKGGQTTTR